MNIEQMAREAGLDIMPGWLSQWTDGLERFAALVRDHWLDKAHAAVQEVRDDGTDYGQADDHLHVAQKRILMLKESA